MVSYKKKMEFISICIRASIHNMVIYINCSMLMKLNRRRGVDYALELKKQKLTIGII